MPSLLEYKQLDTELWKLLFVNGIKEHAFAGPSIDVKHANFDVKADAPLNI
jgi:hypothetical protein